MLHELLGWHGPMTHRQFIVWQCWLNMEMNQPSRQDYYNMQTAFYVARSNAKNPESVRFEKMKLKFRDDTEESNVSPEEMNARIIANSLARLGAVKVRLPDGTYISKKEIVERTLRGNKPKDIDESNNISPNIVIE